jgi:hypothetical protein
MLYNFVYSNCSYETKSNYDVRIKLGDCKNLLNDTEPDIFIIAIYFRVLRVILRVPLQLLTLLHFKCFSDLNNLIILTWLVITSIVIQVHLRVTIYLFMVSIEKNYLGLGVNLWVLGSYIVSTVHNSGTKNLDLKMLHRSFKFRVNNL